MNGWERLGGTSNEPGKQSGFLKKDGNLIKSGVCLHHARVLT